MSEPSTLWKRVKTFARHTTIRQKLAAPLLFAALGVARAIVLTLPFRIYAPLLGELAKDNAPTPSPNRRNANRAMRIGRLIDVIAQFTPWLSNCFARTIVAALCLRMLRIGYSVHFGVAQGEAAALEAHCWVMAGEYPITGFEEAKGMTCLRTFRLEP